MNFKGMFKDNIAYLKKYWKEYIVLEITFAAGTIGGLCIYNKIQTLKLDKKYSEEIKKEELES